MINKFLEHIIVDSIHLNNDVSFMLQKKRDIQTFAYKGARISKEKVYNYHNKEGTANFEVFTHLDPDEISEM